MRHPSLLMTLTITAFSGLLLTLAKAAEPQASSGVDEALSKEGGAAVYAKHCASCHDHGDPAPAKEVLQSYPAKRIEQIITSGVMKPMAAGLTDVQRKAVASYLGRKDELVAAAEIAGCPTAEAGFDYAQPLASNGFGITDARNRRIAPPELAKLTRSDVDRLHPAWSLPLRSPTSPMLAGGGAFTTDLDGNVLALSARTGCLRWRFHAGAPIRSGLVMAPWSGTSSRPSRQAPIVYFGDRSGIIHALNVATGKEVWSAKPYDNQFANVLGTPALFEGKLYVGFSSFEGDAGPNGDPKVSCCTFSGMVAALDASTGKVLWRYFTMHEKPRPIRFNAAGVQQYGPSGAAVLGTPTVDPQRGYIYSTADNNYSDPPNGDANSVFALDLQTGKEIWHRQLTPGNPHNAACYIKGTNCPDAYRDEKRSDWGFKASPVVIKTSRGEVLIAAQKAGVIWGLSPADGKVLWHTWIATRKVNFGTVNGIAVEGGAFYATVSDMLKKPSDGAFDGMEELALYKLDAGTGKVLWKAPVAADCPLRYCGGYREAPIATVGLVLASSTDQFLRIYDGKSGQVLRRFDLAEVGEPRAPSNVGAPTIANEMIYVGTVRRLYAFKSR